MLRYLGIAAIVLTLSALAFTQALSDGESSGPAAPAVQPVNSSASSPPAPAAAFHRDGLWFSTPDKSTHLQVHGYVQGDDRMFDSSTHGEELDTFLFRRIRPIFEGSLFGNVDFRFMPDFGQNNPQIQEAYMELKTLPFAKLRVGKFKEPIGLEALKSDRELTFAERSMASDLVPLRYLGVQLGGSVLKDSITYQAGYFNGTNDGSNGKITWVQGNEAVARVFLRPFAATPATALQHLGFGVAGSAGAVHGVISGLKTEGQTSFFKYSSTALADGQHNRLAPQAYYYVGPFGVMGEYVISSQEVLNKGITGRVRNEAWETTASVVLTGEKNSYGGIRPRDSFEPNRGFRHFGALELAVRTSQVRIGGDAFPLFASSKTAAQSAKEYAVGLNWYMNRYVKLVTDYEHTYFGMASAKVTPLHAENVLMSRIQLVF